jgi:hypothetical protein
MPASYTIDIQMSNKVVISIVIGIGFILCFVAASNTAIMFIFDGRAGTSHGLIYSEVNIVMAALGMVIMFIGKFLKNVDAHLTKALDKTK